MDLVKNSLFKRVVETIRKPGFWFILALLFLITLPHYGEIFKYPGLFAQTISNLGLDRHAFERILYLAPLVWAGFLFGWKGAFITSVIALACMLPRAIFISAEVKDALFESVAVFIIGNAVAFTFHLLRKEGEYRTQLEHAHQELQASEQRYRDLFDNAHDSIWLHDLEENIVVANKSFVRLTGYSLEESKDIKAGSLIAEGCVDRIAGIENPLLRGEEIGRLSEVTMIKKDKTSVFVQLSTTPVYSNGRITGFQHIARDITEQKRMLENQSFYLKQATRSQEEERKRISHELHDDTIQSLIVLSRKLDSLASKKEGMSDENRLYIEQLWQETDRIIKRVRRLSQDLRPAAVDRLGLVAALEWLAANVTEFSGIPVKFSKAGEEHQFSEERKLALFRIVQEALRNVWRHSEATEANIAVNFDIDKTMITIRDNGQGFNIPDKLGDLARDGKLGLAGMYERTQLIGGSLIVHSQPGKGTTVTVELHE